MSHLSPHLRERLREQVVARRMQEVGPLLEEVARDAVFLVRGEPDDYSNPGGTRLGGLPDLPVDLSWPTAPVGLEEAAPNDSAGLGYLLFLAQLNLGELPRTQGSPLPQDGLLYFFADAVGDASNVAVRVLYSFAGRELHNTPFPDPERACFPGDELDTGGPALRPYRVRAHVGVSLPGYGSSGMDRLGLWQRGGYDLEMAYWGLGEELAGREANVGRGANQVLGYPSMRDLAGSEDGLERVLLFQMASSHQVGVSWSDFGTLAFGIRRGDLETLRFDRVHAGIASG